MLISKMFAFVVEETPGNEGVPAIDANGLVLPLMGADMERMESLRKYARQVAQMTRRPVKLIAFSVREELETIEPD